MNAKMVEEKSSSYYGGWLSGAAYTIWEAAFKGATEVYEQHANAAAALADTVVSTYLALTGQCRNFKDEV